MNHVSKVFVAILIGLTCHGPDTASGLVGVLNLSVEVALGGA